MAINFPMVEETQYLKELARSGDIQGFVTRVQRIDWSTRQPEELLKALDLALSLELSRLAIDLAQQAGRLFPNHERAQQAAKVLAPPVARVVEGLHTKGLDASEAWVYEHANEYHGLWIAVREGKLLGAAKFLKDLTGVIGEGEDALNTLVTKVL